MGPLDGSDDELLAAGQETEYLVKTIGYNIAQDSLKHRLKPEDKVSIHGVHRLFH